MSHPTSKVGHVEEIHHIQTPPDLEEEAKTILERHGCTLEPSSEGYLIHFPPGTTRSEILPRTISVYYEITLPDGYHLREAFDWHRDMHMLWYTAE